MFYGCSYMFHLSGDNSRDRYILRALDRDRERALHWANSNPSPEYPIRTAGWVVRWVCRPEDAEDDDCGAEPVEHGVVEVEDPGIGRK